MHFAFTRMPGERYRGRFGSLLLCLCDVFRVMINSLCVDSKKKTKEREREREKRRGGGGGGRRRRDEAIKRLYKKERKKEKEENMPQLK